MEAQILGRLSALGVCRQHILLWRRAGNVSGKELRLYRTVNWWRQAWWMRRITTAWTSCAGPASDSSSAASTWTPCAPCWRQPSVTSNTNAPNLSFKRFYITFQKLLTLLIASRQLQSRSFWKRCWNLSTNTGTKVLLHFEKWFSFDTMIRSNIFF